jgi:hypothetical protein
MAQHALEYYIVCNHEWTSIVNNECMEAILMLNNEEADEETMYMARKIGEMYNDKCQQTADYFEQGGRTKQEIMQEVEQMDNDMKMDFYTTYQRYASDYEVFERLMDDIEEDNDIQKLQTILERAEFAIETDVYKTKELLIAIIQRVKRIVEKKLEEFQNVEVFI